LTRDVQLLGNGRVGGDDFAGMRSSRVPFEEAYHKTSVYHELEQTWRTPKLDEPAHQMEFLRRTGKMRKKPGV
jgi:hypothetical protein